MSKPLAIIRKLRGTWPRTSLDFHERSSAYADAGQFEAAIDDLTQALRLSAEQAGGVADDSDLFYFHFCRGELYMSLKDFAKARDDFEEAAARYGADFGTLDEERACCLMELGEFADALRIFDHEDYAEAGPDVHLTRARCLAGLNRVDEARDAFRECFEEVTENSGGLDEEAHFHRGQFLLDQGRADQALADLSKALELHGRHNGEAARPFESWPIEAYRLSGVAQRSLGNSAAADQATNQADQLEQAQRAHHPRSIRQVHRDIWMGAAGEVAGTMIGVSILLWILGPALYRGVQLAIPLPPLPEWWRVVPISLLSLFLGSLVALVIARWMNRRPRDDGAIRHQQ